MSEVPGEVLMLLLAGGEQGVGGNQAAVALLDWFELEQEVLLVMERPIPSKDLWYYVQNKEQGHLEENQAKVRKCVCVCVCVCLFVRVRA